jgi:hypothetical protein
MGEKYEQWISGEWEWPVRKGFKIGCCDCGLVHRFDFKFKKAPNGKSIMMKCVRDDRATAAVRRKLNKKVEKLAKIPKKT